MQQFFKITCTHLLYFFLVFYFAFKDHYSLKETPTCYDCTLMGPFEG